MFVSTAKGGNAGRVYEIDRVTGSATAVRESDLHLDYGAGIAFDANGHLLVQDSDASMFPGRLQRVPITESGGVLSFDDPPQPILDNMLSSYGIDVDSEGDIFATGKGGLYTVSETPAAETLFYTDGSTAPISTAIAFYPGAQPFEPFAGLGGGRLAFNADYGFVPSEIDLFVTLLVSAVPGDYDGNGHVEEADYLRWRAAYGTTNPAADGNRDGIVDAADYSVWRNHLGTTLGSGAIGAQSAPEPGAWSLAWVALATILSTFQRYRPVRTITWRYCSCSEN
jgi:hypothetical protein